MATRTSAPRSIELLAEQRSHLLVVLSNAQAGADQSFRNWFLGPYQRTVLKLDGVLRGQQYEAHEVDISDGKYPGLPYHYFAIYDLSVDGAAAAGNLALLPRRRTRRPFPGIPSVAPHRRICQCHSRSGRGLR
jgi:hypothetical protein